MNPINTRKAVLYCRVSTKEQAEEGGSLATQEKLCREYALKSGYEIASVFIEQGESAKTADRTELKRLLSYCANRKNAVSAVIAHKIDRIARNIDDYRQIRLMLKKYDVEIRSTTEYFEDTPAGRFMENIIANVAQFDNDVRTERSVNGSKDAMREGRYVWAASIGYSNVKIGGRSTIAPNELAPVVRRVFEEIARDQLPVDTIRQNLHAEGLVGRSGKLLTKSYYYRMLNNQVYMGWIVKFGERHKGTFEPIVSEELFEQVQRILKRRAHRKGIYQKENPDFPLRRFVHDKNGVKLTGSWSQGRAQKYPYYRFIGVSHSDIRKEKLDELYMKFLDRFTVNPKHLVYFRKALHRALDASTEKDVKALEKTRAYIAGLNDRQTSLIEKNGRGIISDSVLRRQLEQIDELLTKATAELYALPPKSTNVSELLDFGSKYLSNPGKVWKMATFEQKVRLQWFEFPQGVIFENGKFRTGEIASIFKVNDIFLTQLSSSVHPRGRNYEQAITTKLNAIPFDTWKHYAEELERLVDILKGRPPNLPEEANLSSYQHNANLGTIGI